MRSSPSVTARVVVAAVAVAFFIGGGFAVAVDFGTSHPILPGHPLRDAVTECSADTDHAVLGDQGRTLTMDTKGKEDDAGLPAPTIDCVLMHLGVTKAVLARVDQARPAGGMQTDSWGGYRARWMRYPGDGLELVVTTVPSPWWA